VTKEICSWPAPWLDRWKRFGQFTKRWHSPTYRHPHTDTYTYRQLFKWQSQLRTGRFCSP